MFRDRLGNPLEKGDFVVFPKLYGRKIKMHIGEYQGEDEVGPLIRYMHETPSHIRWKRYRPKPGSQIFKVYKPSVEDAIQIKGRRDL